MKTILFSLFLFPLSSFAIDVPTGTTSPVIAQPGSNGTPTTGSVDEWTAWGLSQVEAARKRSAIDYAIANLVAGAKCIYSTDRNHPTDTIDVDSAGAGYKVTCFATKQNKPDIYILTFTDVVTNVSPADCVNEAKIREHFTVDMNRNPGSILAFNLKFLSPGCNQVIQSVGSSSAETIKLEDTAAIQWLKGEMDRRVGLKKPAEKAIDAYSRATRRNTGTGANNTCLAGNPLCDSSGTAQ